VCTVQVGKRRRGFSVIYFVKVTAITTLAYTRDGMTTPRLTCTCCPRDMRMESVNVSVQSDQSLKNRTTSVSFTVRRTMPSYCFCSQVANVICQRPHRTSSSSSWGSTSNAPFLRSPGAYSTSRSPSAWHTDWRTDRHTPWSSIAIVGILRMRCSLIISCTHAASRYSYWRSLSVCASVSPHKISTTADQKLM